MGFNIMNRLCSLKLPFLGPVPVSNVEQNEFWSNVYDLDTISC